MTNTPGITISPSNALLTQLADLLMQATTLVRQLSSVQSSPSTPVSIPKLQRPKHVPKDQEWFWSEQWQKGEREANEALAQGRYVDFDDIDEALSYLHKMV